MASSSPRWTQSPGRGAAAAAFVRDAVRDAIDRRCRQHVLRQAAGVLRDGGHEWGDDPAAWVQRQRSGDPRRVG